MHGHFVAKIKPVHSVFVPHTQPIKRNPAFTIAVVGCGGSSTAFLYHFIQKIKNTSHSLNVSRAAITLIDQQGAFGSGDAFSTQRSSCFILNTKPTLLSIDPKDPFHFLNWIKGNIGSLKTTFKDLNFDQITPNSYLPRSLYGAYLESVFREMCVEATKLGIAVSLVHKKALRIQSDSNKAKIVFDNTSFFADHVIIASGTPAPIYNHLSQNPGYLTPTSIPLDRMKKEEPILIIGTSLTALDAIVALDENGHAGKITMISRTGLLPVVQNMEEERLCLNALTPENFKHTSAWIAQDTPKLSSQTISELFLKLLNIEVSTHYPNINIDYKKYNQCPTTKESFDYVLELAKTGNPIQQCLYATRHTINHLWATIPEETQKSILSEHWTKWASQRHPMPMQTAKRVQAMIHKGQLEIKDGISDVKWAEDRYIVSLKDGENLESSILIDATNQGSVLSKDKLIEDLVQKHHIRMYADYGLDIDPNFFLKKPNGDTNALFSALGYPIFGKVITSNAMWFNVESAKILAEKLYQKFVSAPVSPKL